MTNLPISSTPPQSTGNVANVAQTNSLADSQAKDGALRSGEARVGGVNFARPSAEGGLSNSGVSLADAPEPFAALLARQIGGTDAPSINVVPGAINIDGAAPSLKDDQDRDAIAASTPSDQASMLTAMLLQLPQEMRAPITNDSASTSTAPKKADGIEVSTRQSASRIDARLDMANSVPGKTDTVATLIEKRIVADAAGLNVAKHAEQATSQTQPGPNTTQLIASSTISAVMPNMLTNNNQADTTQTITTPLGNSGWADDFSQKISWMSTQKNQIAELHLNPPDLGPLNVVLKISDNQATALFTSPHSAVREALENAIPRLREILADNGISLGNATVSDQSPRDRSAGESLNQGSNTPGQHGIFSGEAETTGASPTTTQTIPVRRHNGMVDTFA